MNSTKTKAVETMIKEAREWIGTPWVHNACIKLVGCDCISFIAAIGVVVNIYFDLPTFYHREPKYDLIYPALKAHPAIREVPIPDVLYPGLILGFRFCGVVHHVALTTAEDTIIHASLVDEKVVETRIHNAERRRLCCAFELVDS